jgi:hypothetical protein
MKHYTIRKLIQGFKLKPSLKGITLIGIPYECRYNAVKVQYKDFKMLINSNSPLLHKEMFKDKFKDNRYYTLYYYEWKPNVLQKTLF